MADPEVVEAMLGVLYDGFRVVSMDVIRRASIDDIAAVESLVQADHEMTRAAMVRSLRECAEAAQAFLDSRPEWGR